MTSPSPKVSNKSYKQLALKLRLFGSLSQLCLQWQGSSHTCSIKMYSKGVGPLLDPIPRTWPAVPRHTILRGQETHAPSNPSFWGVQSVPYLQKPVS